MNKNSYLHGAEYSYCRRKIVNNKIVDEDKAIKICYFTYLAHRFNFKCNPLLFQFFKYNLH